MDTITRIFARGTQPVRATWFVVCNWKLIRRPVVRYAWLPFYTWLMYAQTCIGMYVS